MTDAENGEEAGHRGQLRKARTWWHPLLASVMEYLSAGTYEVRQEILTAPSIRPTPDGGAPVRGTHRPTYEYEFGRDLPGRGGGEGGEGQEYLLAGTA